ncbi:MAG: mercuric transporter MerT family protein [Sulfurospirillaceae bacterium]|nr:mercuric transporter MerT family protein [Sulfurospirillaceae bacterium]
MTRSIDCKNLACPLPVIQVKEAYEKLTDDGILDVELNSYSSIENVKRFAKNQGVFCKVKSKTKEMTVLTLVKGYNCELEDAKKDRSFYALIIGSLISAFLASTCCLAPLLFLIFGVSMGSLSFLQVFAPYHLYFSLFSLLIIAYLWYDYFKRTKERLVCATPLCKNYKLYLGIGTLFVVVLITYPYWANYILE